MTTNNTHTNAKHRPSRVRRTVLALVLAGSFAVGAATVVSTATQGSTSAELAGGGRWAG
jgi:hypothetical protein